MTEFPIKSIVSVKRLSQETIVAQVTNVNIKLLYLTCVFNS